MTDSVIGSGSPYAYTRTREGCFPVYRTAVNTGTSGTSGTSVRWQYTVLRTDGKESPVYLGGRALLRGLGVCEDQPVDRYLRGRGSVALATEPGNVFDVFGDSGCVTGSDTGETTELGIDLTKRGHEVRKLLYAGFSLRLARGGHDPEEILQEVYRGILARNKGKCPFDARKASFGHYVHLVITGILCNYHKREVRRRSVEQVGVRGFRAGGGGLVEMDASESVLASADSTGASQVVGMGSGIGGDVSESGTMLIRFLRGMADDEGLAVTDTERSDIRTIVPYLVLGMTKPEIVRATGLSGPRVEGALSVVRSQVSR